MEDPPTDLLDEPIKLILTHKTPLKRWPWDSKVLDQHGLLPEWRDEGESFVLKDYFTWEGASEGEGDDHIAVLLENGSTYYVYGHHCRIEGTETGNDPTDEQEETPPQILPIIDRGKMISLPGISNKVGTKDRIYNGSNFRWGEFTANGTRIPVSEAITYKLVKLAKYMDGVREHLGNNPIKITSAYRPPKINKAVGGARYSRHLKGDAVDFIVKGMSVVEVFNKLKDYHRSGGLAPGNGFNHLDMRPGGARRWRYPRGPKIPLW